jgi:hypothetical protein
MILAETLLSLCFFWCARHGVWRCSPRQLKALLKTTARRLQYMQLLSDDPQVSDQSVSAYSTHRGSGWVSHRWISVRLFWKGWGRPRPRRIVASTAWGMNCYIRTAVQTDPNGFRSPGRYAIGFMRLGRTWVVLNHTYWKNPHILNLLNLSKISVIYWN